MEDSPMKSFGMIGTIVLSFTLGCAVSSHAQQAQLGQRVQNVDNQGVGLIPNYRYRAHFGQEHKFHLSRAVYGQDRRFQYGGYSFGFVDEWPTNWLPKEDVFVTQIDGGYYLCNRRYPGVTIPLSIAASANRDASIRPSRSRAPKASRAKGVTSATARAG
jgi:hypothetical protein